jgi:hypothetical protein
VNHLLDEEIRRNGIPDYGDVLGILETARRSGDIDVSDTDLTNKGMALY